MASLIVLLLLTLAAPVGLIMWNKTRIRGKMLCYFARKDKSIVGALCELRSAFVIWQDRAYDVYPEFIRISRYPSGWPSILQEAVPAALYDEEDALPKDWVSLDTPKEGSLSLRAALDENWIKKLVAETAPEGGFKFNWRKVLPIAFIGIGVIGLIFILTMSGSAPPAD